MGRYAEQRLCELAYAGYQKIFNILAGNKHSGIALVHPTTIDAKDYSKLRIAPMVRDCPTLSTRVAAPKSRDSGNTVLQKTYPGGILTLCGSTEAHALASKPIRYVFGDERDRWAKSAGDEGDPWKLAMARQTTFYNAKAVEVSTPTIKGASPIVDSYNEGTMERWKSQCPHCGEYHEITWEDIRFEHEEQEVNHQRVFKVTKVFYMCPGCACVSDELTMKRQPAKWEADNPVAYENGVRSFWLNAFVSQWKSWESIVLDFLQAQGDSRKMQVVYNTVFGKLWENRGDLEDEEGMLARREEYPAELPEGVLVLTCGIDTQDDRLEYEVVGHGHFDESWGIEKGIIMGRPDSDETWAALDDVLDKVYHFEDGLGLKLSMSFMDEGGHFTQEVRQRCQERIGKKLFCIKGLVGQDRPYTTPPKRMKIVINGAHVGGCWQYQIGVDAGKQRIMDNLRAKEPGPRHCHFPKRDDYGPGYFSGLLSEHLVFDEKSVRHPWKWEKIPGHERNEVLDCRNYANAAFKVLPKDLDAIHRRLNEARARKAPGAALVDTPPTARPPAPRSRVKRTSRMEEW
ncbi:terminase gpA endonuclease subunit [Oscillospiraceae bacterium 42-9]